MLNIPEYESARDVFYYFEQISKIPHGSGNTDKIAEYLVSFATEHGLWSRRDGANNVIIKKPATRGYEGHPTVILQGHTDMVAEKVTGSDKDMEKEGLQIYRDGDFLRADGTTLGGDDGVAVAYALALLSSDDIPHPPIEAIFTSDEEIGLLGAVALDTCDVDGRMMINIDSDCEGVFTVGCAGGVRIDIKVPMRVTKTQRKCYKLKVDGLKGGHSGVEINSGRENAIKILSQMLAELDCAIGGITGGNADNAIPREATCLVDATPETLSYLKKKYRDKYSAIEPDISVSYAECEGILYTDVDSANLIGLINEEPCGVIAMSSDIEGLVETSLNLGIIRCDENEASLTFSIRSAKGAEKEKLATRVTKTAENYGAKCTAHGEYPAWEYKKESPLCDVMCRVYEEMYEKSPKVETIHAGLECGIFAGKLDGLDCVSVGPNNYDIHTTEERLSISSTVRVWEFLKNVLKRI